MDSGLKCKSWMQNESFDKICCSSAWYKYLTLILDSSINKRIEGAFFSSTRIISASPGLFYRHEGKDICRAMDETKISGKNNIGVKCASSAIGLAYLCLETCKTNNNIAIWSDFRSKNNGNITCAYCWNIYCYMQYKCYAVETNKTERAVVTHCKNKIYVQPYNDNYMYTKIAFRQIYLQIYSFINQTVRSNNDRRSSF